MSTELLERRFAVMGARLTVEDGPWLGAPRIDIRSDRFVLAFTGSGEPAEAEVIDVAPADRHLLLLTRQGDEKSKFLCGHDERHWFVAAVPEAARGVTGVETAKAALQPLPVAHLAAGLPRKRRFDRRTPMYLRQGEWFFLPAVGLQVPDWLVLNDEPLARPGGTPHVLRNAYRRGGVQVYVGPNGTVLSEAAFERWFANRKRNGNWRRMIRDPELFARGTVRHPDHATIDLRGWHRVVMNTEQGAKAMRHVAFLD